MQFLKDLQKAEYGLRVTHYKPNDDGNSFFEFTRPSDHKFTEEEIFALEPFINEHLINGFIFKSNNPHDNKSLHRKFESELLKEGAKHHKEGTFLEFIEYLKNQNTLINPTVFKLIDNKGTEFKIPKSVFSKIWDFETDEGETHYHQLSLREFADLELLNEVQHQLKIEITRFIKEGIDLISKIAPAQDVKSSEKTSPIPKTGSFQRVQGAETFLTDFHEKLVKHRLIEKYEEVNNFKASFRNKQGEINVIPRTPTGNLKPKYFLTDQLIKHLAKNFPSTIIKEFNIDTYALFASIFGFINKKALSQKVHTLEEGKNPLATALKEWLDTENQNLG